MTASRLTELDATIRRVLDDQELGYETPRLGAFSVTLPGVHKLTTTAWLIVGEHSLVVEAFVVRAPDENHAAFYRHLLEKNTRMYGVHFCLDRVGDVFLVGRVPLTGVDSNEIDRLLGCVLAYCDDSFDSLLELGFATAIRREWAWRTKRGESRDNLAAFARFADPDRQQ